MLRYWHVDAFAAKPFDGNPAIVVELVEELPDALLHAIAKEMNQSETAYVLPPTATAGSAALPMLRWFTSEGEIDLCGHATLASAHVYLTQIDPSKTKVTFDTKFSGRLDVSTKGRENLYEMRLPIRQPAAAELPQPDHPTLEHSDSDEGVPSFVLQALRATARPVEAYCTPRDLMLVYPSEAAVRSIRPDFVALGRYSRYIIVTAPPAGSDRSGGGEEEAELQQSGEAGGATDFVSRFFCPNDAVPEDPVTGSAHCTLAPYWAARLGKTDLVGYQASERGGLLRVKVVAEKQAIFVSGQACIFASGHMNPLPTLAS
ncbi:putative isomerase [Diplonema papillatum]|nr:putative isomerase [Diplonema papillatum]